MHEACTLNLWIALSVVAGKAVLPNGTKLPQRQTQGQVQMFFVENTQAGNLYSVMWISVYMISVQMLHMFPLYTK